MRLRLYVIGALIIGTIAAITITSATVPESSMMLLFGSCLIGFMGGSVIGRLQDD